VESLQALAWDIKGDDTIKARARRNGELRNFMVPPDFSKRRVNFTQVFNDPTPPVATIGLAAAARLFAIAHSSFLMWGV
jgi:hypothetical protein